MAVVLTDYIKRLDDPLKKAFIMDLLRFSPIIDILPFESVEALMVNAERWETLPGAGFRKINSGYTESSGKTEEIQETLALLGGDVKIDKVLTRNTLPVQMEQKAKAVAFEYNDAFINGNQAVDPDSFEGLKQRVANAPSRQTIDLATGGVTLKVFASTANENAFIDALHRALKFVDFRASSIITKLGGVPAASFFMNENSWLGVGQTLRRVGLLKDIEDQWDRVFESFRGAPLIDVGLQADKLTEIITNIEDAGDAADDSSSIYVARMGGSDGLMGIQLAGTDMNVYDPLNGNELESGPQFLRRIDWPTGLMNTSQQSLVRIKGFKMNSA